MDIFKLLRNSQLRLHHIEEQWGRHDGTAVNLEIIVFLHSEVVFFDIVTNHRVVGLSIVVKSNLVKSPAARLPPNVLLNHLHILWVKAKQNLTQNRQNVKEYIWFYIRRFRLVSVCFVSDQSDNSNLSLIQSLCFCWLAEVWSQLSVCCLRSYQNSRKQKRVKLECGLTFISMTSLLDNRASCHGRYVNLPTPKTWLNKSPQLPCGSTPRHRWKACWWTGWRSGPGSPRWSTWQGYSPPCSPVHTSPLSIGGAEADSPLVGVTTSQLWDVICWRSSSVASAPTHLNQAIYFALINNDASQIAVVWYQDMKKSFPEAASK